MRKITNKRNRILQTGLAIALCTALINTSAQASDKLTETIAGKHRTEKYTARDNHRNPLETLNFFGIKEDMKVVEIWPGGGWYTEILAPYLKDKGQYIAAGFDPDSEVEYYKRNAKKLQEKLAANPALYNKATVTIMQPPKKIEFAEENSTDMVVSFRNTHNWHRRGYAEDVYNAIFKVLKPGGVFGVVQHRAGKDQPKDTSGEKGYLKQSDVIAMAEKAGFKLVAQSEINANSKDTKDYEHGVWTLPPSFRLKDKNREKYAAIGESDRMTLKFVKPAQK